MERPAGMPRQPLPHLRMFVCRVIVDDCVDHFSRRDLRLDRIEEADELLVPMALHVAADDGAVEDVEGSEERGGTVTLVVVRHRPRAPRLHRQPRLGTVERFRLPRCSTLLASLCDRRRQKQPIGPVGCWRRRQA